MRLFPVLLVTLVAAVDFSTCLEQQDFSPACVKIMLSKTMGTLLVVFSTVVKLPQILKIIGAKSVAGLSATSFYTEVLSFGLMAAYSHHNQQPLSTYGESVTIFFQCVLQVMLLWTYGVYSSNHIRAVLCFFLGVFGLLASGYFPEAGWQSLILFQFPFNVIVKGSQIWANFSQGSTGQLSFITNFMNLGGTAVRVFTTLVEVKDQALVFNYLLTTALNLTIVAQILWYWNKPAPTTKRD